VQYLEEREKQYDQRVIIDVWGRPDQLGEAVMVLLDL
jgi:hypothetical protein